MAPRSASTRSLRQRLPAWCGARARLRRLNSPHRLLDTAHTHDHNRTYLSHSNHHNHTTSVTLRTLRPAAAPVPMCFTFFFTSRTAARSPRCHTHPLLTFTTTTLPQHHDTHRWWPRRSSPLSHCTASTHSHPNNKTTHCRCLPGSNPSSLGGSRSPCSSSPERGLVVALAPQALPLAALVGPSPPEQYVLSVVAVVSSSASAPTYRLAAGAIG